MNVNDISRIRQGLGQVSVLTLLCAAVVLPAIVVSADLPFFKVEQLLLPIILAIYGFCVLTGIARPPRWNIIFIVGLLYCLCSALSMWYGAEVLGHRVIVRDLYELPKVFLPVAFFTVAYETELGEASLQRAIKVFSLAILPVCFYAWAQFAGLSFSYALNPYYSSGGHIDQALLYAGRVYSTMGNPNVLGQLMTWCLVLFVLAALFRAGNRAWNMAMASCCLITLAMTGSRFGLLTGCLGLALIFVAVSSHSRRKLAQIGFLILLVSIFAWTYQIVASTNRRTLERYQTLRDPLNIDSLRQRLDDVWRDEWQDFTKSPLLGHGPVKALDRRGYYDSEYLGVLRENGVIGLFVFLGYYVYPLYCLRKGQRALAQSDVDVSELAPATAATIHAAFIMGVLALVMNVAMSTFYSPFLQGFLWLWFGIGTRSALTIRGWARSSALSSFSAQEGASRPRELTPSWSLSVNRIPSRQQRSEPPI